MLLFGYCSFECTRKAFSMRGDILHRLSAITDQLTGGAHRARWLTGQAVEGTGRKTTIRRLQREIHRQDPEGPAKAGGQVCR